MLHDRDRKFAASFDRVFESGGARVVLTPLMAPKANAHAERWIGSCRRECLDWMLIASEGHLRRVLREYRDHYNDERPHRSRELRPPSGTGDPVSVGAGDTINRSVRLGGLLSHYQLRMRAA
jgi:putative transposase